MSNNTAVIESRFTLPELTARGSPPGEIVLTATLEPISPETAFLVNQARALNEALEGALAEALDRVLEVVDGIDVPIVNTRLASLEAGALGLGVVVDSDRGAAVAADAALGTRIDDTVALVGLESGNRTAADNLLSGQILARESDSQARDDAIVVQAGVDRSAASNALTDATDALQADIDGREPTFTKRTGFNRAFGSSANTVTEGNDARLSDNRAPKAHTHDAGDLNAGLVPNARIPSSAVTQHQGLIQVTEAQVTDLGDYVDVLDPRLADARAPTAHDHVKADIADFDDADYASAVHAHVKSDLTDFDDADYASAAQGQRADTALQVLPAHDHSYALGDLTDVIDALGAVDGDSLVYSGGQWTAANVAAGASIDHGSVSGLGDDDHPHYLTEARGDARYDTSAEVEARIGTRAALVHGHDASDLTSGSVNDARVPASAITQHAASLSIARSQIPDFGSYAAANDPRLVDARAPTAHDHDAADLTSGLVPDARIGAGAVTQHQASLALSTSQLTDFSADDYASAAQGGRADAALARTGGTLTGVVTGVMGSDPASLATRGYVDGPKTGLVIRNDANKQVLLEDADGTNRGQLYATGTTLVMQHLDGGVGGAQITLSNNTAFVNRRLVGLDTRDFDGATTLASKGYMEDHVAASVAQAAAERVARHDGVFTGELQGPQINIDNADVGGSTITTAGVLQGRDGELALVRFVAGVFSTKLALRDDGLTVNRPLSLSRDTLGSDPDFSYATKGYVDANAGGGISELDADERYVQRSGIQTLDASLTLTGYTSFNGTFAINGFVNSANPEVVFAKPIRVDPVGAAPGRITLREAAANGTEALTIEAPPAMPAGYTVRFPAGKPVPGQGINVASVVGDIVQLQWS